MNAREDFFSALAITAIGLGMDFVSGRSIAAFYGQMGSASWLGVISAAIVFGMSIGGSAYLARRMGTRGLTEAFGHLPLGGLAAFLYHVFLMTALCLLAVSAGHVGALVLPVKHGAAWGMAAAILLALILALSGENALRGAAALLAGCIALFFAALLAWGRTPEREFLRYGLVLRLRNRYGLALALGSVHGGLCGVLSAGVTLRFVNGCRRPVRLGFFSAAVFGLLLSIGNGVLHSRDERLLGLKLPFVALAGGWGNAGFYLCAALVFLSSAMGMAGLIYAFLPGSNLHGK